MSRIILTPHAFNELFNQVEEETRMRFFVQDNEIVMYAEDECHAHEIEEARKKGEDVGELDGVLAVIPYKEESTRQTPQHDASAALSGAVQTLMHQVNQMRGLFNDEDGTIKAALDEGESALAQAQTEAPFVVVELDGGLVQNVYTNTHCEYMTVDLDTEGADPEDLKTIPGMDEAHVSGVYGCTLNLALVERARSVAEIG